MHMDKAFELGKLVGQRDEYKALRRAQEDMEQATELKLKFDRMEQLADQLQQTAAQGNEPPKDEIEEYDRLFSEAQADPRYQQLAAAQSNFDKLMTQVQQRIAEGMQKGAESPIIILS